MSETLLERNKKVAQRFFYELVNDRDYSVIPRIFPPDVEIRFGIKGLAGIGLDGIEGAHKWLRHFHDAFSDCRDELLGQWAEGDVVVTRLFNSVSRPSWRASSTSVCRNRQIDMWSGVFWIAVARSVAFEMRTVAAMTLRSVFWLGVAWHAYARRRRAERPV